MYYFDLNPNYTSIQINYINKLFKYYRNNYIPHLHNLHKFSLSVCN